MIVPCPACQTQFNVEINALSEAGRKVRCTKCGEIWHQMPANGVNSIAEQSGEDEHSSIADRKFNQKGEDENSGERDIENLLDSKSNIASHTQSQSKKEMSPNDKIKDKSLEEGSGGVRGGWLFFIVVLCGLCGGGYFYHVKITEIWPPAGPLFEMIGLGQEKH